MVGRRAFVLTCRDAFHSVANISVGTSRVTRRHVEIHGEHLPLSESTVMSAW